MAREVSEQEQRSSSSIEQDQGLSFSIAFQAYASFLSMLGVLAQLKSQGNNVSLFEKHGAIMYSFVVAISIYLGTIILGKKFGTEAIGHIRLLSGTIAPILFFLILVPIFGWLLLVLWVFLAAKMAWDYLLQLYHYLLSLGSEVSNLFVILMICDSTSAEGPQELPV